MYASFVQLRSAAGRVPPRAERARKWWEALRLAWFHGNAWRGPGMPRFGSPPVSFSESKLRYWSYVWAHRLDLGWWPPPRDATGRGPSVRAPCDRE